MSLSQAEQRILASHKSRIETLSSQVSQLVAVVQTLQARPVSPQEEIDQIPGRRIENALTGEVAFDVTDINKRAQPIIMNVSQDGPFIQTHYPLVLWRPSAPSNAANLNRWRPVSTFPLPDQVVDTDIIDILYEMFDGGAGRQFQNAPRSAGLLSRPDNLVPLPIPTLWSPNSNIQFQPTYLALTWDGSPAPTQGILHVDLPGYRVVNL